MAVRCRVPIWLWGWFVVWCCREADLEDFINRLFNKASMSPDGTGQPGWQFPSQQAGASQSWGGATSSSNSKRSRRKKKRNWVCLANVLEVISDGNALQVEVWKGDVMSSAVPACCGLQMLGVGAETVEGDLKGHLVIHKFLLGLPASCRRVRKGLQDNWAYKNWQSWQPLPKCLVVEISGICCWRCCVASVTMWWECLQRFEDRMQFCWQKFTVVQFWSSISF